MQNNHAIVDFTLATALADGGTQAVSYPSGTTEGEFAGGRDHRIVALQHEFKAPKDFHITFGDASFTINWNAAATLAAGTPMSIQLDRPGDSTPVMRGRNRRSRYRNSKIVWSGGVRWLITSFSSAGSGARLSATIVMVMPRRRRSKSWHLRMKRNGCSSPQT